MRIEDIAIDYEGIEAGVWRAADGIPGVSFKLKGVPNAAWSALETGLRRRSQPPTPEAIQAECLLGACLLDWRGFTTEDGAPEPFSPERAREVITQPQYRRIRNSVFATAAIFGNETALERAAAGSNIAGEP